jgi:phosphatidylserine/phosphatidylglycerophosphate/cardiolipin synthase-like enzyme
MRRKRTSQGLSVRAIAGTHAVLLAMDYPEAQCPGLRGFGIHRTDHTENEAYWLSGTKVFPSADPGLAPGSQVPTRDHPIQDFGWGDYSAKPGHTYSYRVVAFKGEPGALVPVAEVKVKVTAESPEGGDHDIYFNRGTGASQAYARRFGNRKPGSVGGAADPAWAWLSRGCAESIRNFVARAADSSWGLRVAAYELHEERVLAALAAAVGRGVDVLILHDADKKSPGPQNRAALAAAGIPDALILDRRTSAISHNKAIVLLHDGEPSAVLTGSTNFSPSGIYGHSNAVHIVEDQAVARAYLDYWTELAANPAPKDLKAALSATPLPPLPPSPGTATVFSPRPRADALDYYAALAGRAKGALFMTFAFGMHDLFKEVFATGKAPLRYALFEELLGPADKTGDADAAMREMIRLRRMVENRFAVGARIPGDVLDGWLHESLTGLSRNVLYIHTKYMLIDPLGDDPIVVAGSANFSKASSDANDENMLVIRDNRRVADLYLTEFMRLWEHFAFREWAGRANAEDRAKPRLLDETDRWWQRHFGGSALSRHREYFIS